MSNGYCNPQDPNADVADLFPAGSEPEDRTSRLDPACVMPLDQRTVTGVLRQFLLHHFSSPDKIINSQLRQQLEDQGGWSDSGFTAIYIESIAAWKKDQLQSRPAIIIKEGAWRWRRLAGGNLVDMDPERGVHYFWGQWQGTHTLFCIAKEPGEAQNVATEAARVLQWYARDISAQLRLYGFAVLQLGTVASLEESREHYVVPINVGYVIDEQWSLQQDAPRIHKVSIGQ